jgi:hypothetical protein
VPIRNTLRELAITTWAKLRGRTVTVERFRVLDSADTETAPPWLLSCKDTGTLDPANESDDGQLSIWWVDDADVLTSWGDSLSRAARAAANPEEPPAPFSPSELNLMAAWAQYLAAEAKVAALNAAENGQPVTPPRDPLPPDELRRLLAREAAATINHTLARLFIQLGPPPEGADGDLHPVGSDDGGVQQ